MNITTQITLSDKILKNGIRIKDKEYLKELYPTNNLYHEFENIKDSIENYDYYNKLLYTFGFYIGFFNLYSEIDIKGMSNDKLPGIEYLKGSLMIYFKDKLKIKYNYFPVHSYFNSYSFVADWYPQPFSIPHSLKIILNWIYLYDKAFFYNLIFNEKHNYIFLSLFKGRIIRNFKIDKEYIDFECEDLKLYSIFHYLMYPYTDEGHNLNLSEKSEIWKYNSSIINLIPTDKLIKMIVDLIMFRETEQIPHEILMKIFNNLEKFYEEIETTNIMNIYELKQISSINRHFTSKTRLFNIIINKLKVLLTNEYITIDEYGWEMFLLTLDYNELELIKKLLNDTKNDLKFLFELDEELRYKKFLIDYGKLEKLDELQSICDEILLQKIISSSSLK